MSPRLPSLFLAATLAHAAGCGDPSSIDRDSSLQGTWTYSVEGTGYVDTLTLREDGDLQWEHLLDTMVLSTGPGTWYTALTTFTVMHEYSRDTTTGNVHFIVPYAVEGDRACMLSCRPLHLDGSVLSSEIHMTDSEGRGPIRLEARDVRERWEYRMRSGGDCTVTHERTLADSVGGTPYEETTSTSFSCIYDQDAGTYSFSVVWEEADYPDSYVFLPFGDAFVLEEELALIWTRVPSP